MPQPQVPTIKKPLVTIAIPTYNRAAKTLPAALRSALGQTYENVEIIVSDNCSTDNTEQVVREFGPRIKYVRQTQNLGLNGNLNQCIDRATGDYLLLLHDDDLIDADFVESCIAAVGNATSVGFIRTGIRIIGSDGTVLSERPNLVTESSSVADLMLAWFRNETAQYCCNMLFNTRALREIGGFQSRNNLYQDAIAQVKVAALYGHAHVKEPKASFRRHDENAGAPSRAGISNWCEDSLQLVEVICSRAQDREAELRQEAMRYFCLVNYLSVGQLKSRTQRLYTYPLVARHFNFAASPIPHIYQNEVRPLLRALKRLLLPRSARRVVRGSDRTS